PIYIFVGRMNWDVMWQSTFELRSARTFSLRLEDVDRYPVTWQCFAQELPCPLAEKARWGIAISNTVEALDGARKVFGAPAGESLGIGCRKCGLLLRSSGGQRQGLVDPHMLGLAHDLDDVKLPPANASAGAIGGCFRNENYGGRPF